MKHWGVMALAMGILGLGGVALPAGAAESGKKLTFNGKTASTNIQTINGQAFVSLADMAKALGMAVVKKADGSYELTKAGGTFQVGDMNGKLGDVLFDGKWRLQVLTMDTPESFSMLTVSQPYGYDNSATYDQTTRVLRPTAAHKLVVFTVRVSNGQKTPESLWTSNVDKAMRTALTDMDGQSYPPIAYDYEGGPNATKPQLPGAKLNFPIIFSVPQSAVLKDLIVTLKNNDSSAKGNDVRISLISVPK